MTVNDQNTVWVEGKRAIEAILYDILADKLNEARIHESAKLLNEADPKPRVEKDIQGKPVVPTTAQFTAYFQQMQASHIADMLDTTHKRWEEATKKKDKDDMEQAEFESMDRELSIGGRILTQKRTGDSKTQAAGVKKFEQRKKSIHKTLKSIFKPKSKMSHAIAQHLAGFLAKHEHPMGERS